LHEYLFPVGFICKEFALKTFDIFFTQHTFKAIKEKHLHLGINVIFSKAVLIGMIEQCFQYYAGSAAKR